MCVFLNTAVLLINIIPGDTVASQQEGSNPPSGWGLSVESLHIVPVPAWVSESKSPGPCFIPSPSLMQVHYIERRDNNFETCKLEKCKTSFLTLGSVCKAK